MLFLSSSINSSLRIHNFHKIPPRRLKFKCKCDRSEDVEDEEQRAKDDEEKKEGLVVEGNDENSLSRTPCHDSGIDIRDSLPTVPIIPTKKVKKNLRDSREFEV